MDGRWSREGSWERLEGGEVEREVMSFYFKLKTFKNKTIRNEVIDITS